MIFTDAYYKRKYLGKEVVVVLNGHEVKSFVSGVDPTKGISIKPLDPDTFPVECGFAINEDGTIVCLNMEVTYSVSRESIFDYLINCIRIGFVNVVNANRFTGCNPYDRCKSASCSFK